jgi:GTPase SAR1 family protein
MAGTGKTSLMQRLNAYLSQKKQNKYTINLDPAVLKLPYGSNIDIRDTVDYKQVMSQYSLGPNGAILTSLNLFATKFDQVLDLLEKRSPTYCLVDTPGQIEIFTWSASGQIITDALAFAYPTCIMYVIDTPRCTNPVTFMSNMLYACSILYKTKLPFVLVFNKCDVVSHEFCVEWMKDFGAFQAALEEDETYMGTLVNSMCLVLEEFYNNLRVVGVSALSGQGMDELFEAIGEATKEYETEYKPMLEEQMRKKKESEEEKKRQTLQKLMSDLQVE